MTTTPNTPELRRDALLKAITPHVVFDGWGEAAFGAALAETGIAETEARAVCPRGAVDLAVAGHRAGDAAMLTALADADLASMRYSERVAFAVRVRLDVAGEREVVRRATTLFALPQYSGDGAALIWGTADAIWNALGDSSRDVNWYTKRMTLSGVYASAVLFWLGDTSEGAVATRDFIDRRIANVMAFEKFKADARGSRLLGPLAGGLESLLSNIRAPEPGFATDLPGSLKGDPKR